ncbi:MAG: pyridoxal phosphate-dependent aminotransferase [Oscillospiraceae bacterium]
MMDAPHGGDIYAYDRDLLDFSVNLNPLGMPDRVLRAIREHAEEYDRYPDPHCRALRRALSVRESVPEKWLVFGNGAADLIVRLCMVLKPKRALLPAPTFSEYEKAVRLAGGEVRRFFLRQEAGYQVTADYADAVQPGDSVVFLCNPNNPTGALAEPGTVEALLSACGQVGAVLVVDECFLPFTDGRSCQSRLRAYPNLMVLRAFTKLYAMAGLRLGYLMCADEDLAGRIGAWGQSWSVSAPAQVAGLTAVSEEGWPERTRRFLRMERPWMTDALGALGFFVYPSHSNFLLFQARPDLWDRAMARGVMLRPCSNFPGLDGSYFRIGLKKRVQNEMLLQVLKEIGG